MDTGEHPTIVRSSDDNYKNNRTRKSKFIKKSNTEQEYIITLQFLNLILQAIGKHIIDHITLFKDIERKDLMSNNVMDIINTAIVPVYTLFGKPAIQFHKKDGVHKNGKPRSECY